VSQFTHGRTRATIRLQFREVSSGDDVVIKDMSTFNLGKALKECTHPMAVLMMSLVPQSGGPGHSNALIVDFRARTYERFEPNGNYWPGVDDYLDTDRFRAAAGLQGYTYIAPLDYCPAEGPQVKAEAGSLRNCPDGGYCQIVTMIYLHLRMLMPNYDRAQIVGRLIELGGRRLEEVVRRYMSWITAKAINTVFLDGLQDISNVPRSQREAVQRGRELGLTVAQAADRWDERLLRLVSPRMSF
jgi:hypothetical protein